MSYIIAKTENLLTEKELIDVEKHIINSLGFEWFKRIVSVDTDKTTPWFSHPLVSRPEKSKNLTSTLDSPFAKFFMRMVERMCEQNDIEFEKFYRGNLNCTLSNSKEKFFTKPHTDHKFKHKNFLLYLTDCSGDTVFFDKDNLNDPIHSESPKKNKAIIFEGDIPHTHKPCKGNEERIICVFTFI